MTFDGAGEALYRWKCALHVHLLAQRRTALAAGRTDLRRTLPAVFILAAANSRVTSPASTPALAGGRFLVWSREKPPCGTESDLQGHVAIVLLGLT